MKSLLIAALFLFSFKSQAWIADVNADIISEAASTTSESKTSRQFIAVGVLGDLGKGERARYYLGWGIISASAKDTNSSPAYEQTLSTLDMGPTFRMHFDPRGLYTATFTYAIFAKGTLATAATDEKLTGSSYHLKFAIEPSVTERLFIGFALNYYSASYSKSVASSVESDVSYKMTRMFPSFSLSYRY